MMNNLDQENNNGNELSEDIEGSINIKLNTAIAKGDTLQTEHENYIENTQKNFVRNENTLALEKSDIGSLAKGEITDPGLSPIGNQDKNNMGQTAVNSNKNMHTKDDSNKPTSNELNDIDSVSVVQSVGHLLRNARMAKGMSIEDISRQLRLSVQQIEAIEKEDFEKLPGRTFLRGFIRNYANLVQLDPIPLLQLLPESTPVISTYERTPLKNKQISFSSNRESSGSNQFVIAAVLFIIILGAYFIFENGNWIKKSNDIVEGSEAKVDSEKTSVEIQLTLPAAVKSAINSPVAEISETSNQINDKKTPEVEANTKTEIIQKENKSRDKEIENAVTSPSDSDHLHFKLTADSWIKVVDVTGATLFEQIKTRGTEQIVTGKKPLSIVLGNASGVNLTYNGTEVDIPSYRRQDGTARFTLE